MKNHLGFTLIELIIFIVITSLLASTIVLALINSTQKTPTAHNQMIATATAAKCMEWYIGQRKMLGYSAVPVSTSTPSFCTTPSGYSIAVAITTETINSDSNYRKIVVTVSGSGDAVLTSLIGLY